MFKTYLKHPEVAANIYIHIHTIYVSVILLVEATFLSEL